MKLTIRLDDITPDMDWQKFNRFEKLLDTYQVVPLIGVVPENKDVNLKKMASCDDFFDRIKLLEKKGWQIALHGMNHTYTTNKGGCFPLNNFSEFAGITLQKQKDMLAKGKQILCDNGIKTKIFMAPAHTYDYNTIKALKMNDFECITDGFGHYPYFYKGIKFYPISFNRKKSLKQKKGFTTLIVHTNTLEDKDFDYYEKLIKEQREKFISYKSYLEIPCKKCGWIGKSKEYFMALIKQKMVKIMSNK